METTEKIVEAYVRYVKGWFTIPNIKCDGQLEIDLLAVEDAGHLGLRRYHIESGVSISGHFSRLNNKLFSADHLKIRTKQPAQRRTLGYFVQKKFGDPHVREKLRKFGFERKNYSKIIVSWGWESDVPAAARRFDVELWDFQDMLREIADHAGNTKTYFTDDTIRTLQLMAKAVSGK